MGSGSGNFFWWWDLVRFDWTFRVHFRFPIVNWVWNRTQYSILVFEFWVGTIYWNIWNPKLWPSWRSACGAILLSNAQSILDFLTKINVHGLTVTWMYVFIIIKYNQRHNWGQQVIPVLTEWKGKLILTVVCGHHWFVPTFLTTVRFQIIRKLSDRPAALAKWFLCLIEKKWTGLINQFLQDRWSFIKWTCHSKMKIAWDEKGIGWWIVFLKFLD
jgi:hypothetical protein